MFKCFCKRISLIHSPVNELSNTMDLPSTLLRAQALFRRFQRTVEAIDKTDNFPTPVVRQRRPAEGTLPSSPQTASSSKTTGADPRRVGHARVSSSSEQVTPEMLKNKIVSPELRALLSRKVEKLDKKAVEEHGGGIGAPSKRIIREV